MSHRQLRPRPQLGASSSPRRGPMESASGIRYAFPARPSRRTLDRAEKGFHDSNIRFAYSSEQPEDSSITFGFMENIEIRIGDPQSRFAVPDCSCGAIEDGIPCKHLFWFVDQIAQQGQHEGTIPIASDASHLLDSSIYQLVKEIIGLQSFVQILTQYNAASPDNPDPADLSAILGLRHQAFDIFRSFETWIVHGPLTTNVSAFAPALAFDVAQTAEHIEQLIVAIRQRCEERRSLKVTSQAIILLCDILTELLLWDKDAHATAHASWGFPNVSEPGGSGRNNPVANLYARLMKLDPIRPNIGIIETLNMIGHDLLLDHADRLRHLVQQVQNAGASPGHVDQARRLLARLDSMDAGASASGIGAGRRRSRSPPLPERGESARGRVRYM